MAAVVTEINLHGNYGFLTLILKALLPIFIDINSIFRIPTNEM